MKLSYGKQPVKNEEYNRRMREINERYDDHLNEMLPEYLHRGDITPTARLLGYADAMMATCATFLVIPLRNLKEMHGDQQLHEYLKENVQRFVIFFIGFLVVLTIWENLNIRALIIKRVDDMLVFFTTLTLLATTVLPFSLALQGYYPQEKTTILMTTVVLAVMYVVEIITLIYAMECRRLLHFELYKYHQKEMRVFRNVLIAKPAISIVLLGVGGAISIWNPVVSWVFVAFLILTPLMRKTYLYIRRRMASRERFEKCKFYFLFTKGNISKERVEAMSDAAVAIIACILVLDITVEEFPTREVVSHYGSLMITLEHMSSEFFTFFACFAIVSCLWFTNHTILHLFRTINIVTLYLQKFFLAFTCLTPLAANMMLKFATKGNRDASTALMFNSVLVFLASLTNLLILMYGMLTRGRFLEPWAYVLCRRANAKQHIYTILKTLNLPFYSLICIFASFGPPETAFIVTCICMPASLVTFFLFKFFLMNHVGKDTIHITYDQGTSEAEKLNGPHENKIKTNDHKEDSKL